LVNTVLDAFNEEGINVAALFVKRSNDSGNAFWESMGFDDRTDLIYRNKRLNECNL
jgi:ribosomal protein S18 acetylase RimI-like enzyme